MINVVAMMTCFNRREKTVECVRTLKAVSDEKINIKIVVVDDNSSDGTKEAVEQFEGTKVISGNGNLFYTRGMYQAFVYVKESIKDADFYMLVNDDVKFDSKILKNLIMKSKKDRVLIGATRDSEGNFSYGGTLYTKGIKYEAIGPDKKDVYCTTFNGNCVLIPHEIFFQTGNIDSFYQHGMGDFDYGFQISRKGIKINVFEEFVGICNKNPVEGTWNDRNLSRIQRLRKKESFKGLPFRDWFYFLNKNFGFITAVFRSLTPYVKIILGR